MKINTIPYTVAISPKLIGGYYVIGVIPESDFTKGIEWKISKNLLEFQYNEGEENSTTYFSISNSGLLDIDFKIDIQNSDKTTAEPMDGSLPPGKTVEITITTCIEKECTLPSLAITNQNALYSMCYLPLSVSSTKKLLDCSLKDIGATVKRCSGTTRDVFYSYKQPQTCSGGLTLPDTTRIPCGKDNSNKK